MQFHERGRLPPVPARVDIDTARARPKTVRQSWVQSPTETAKFCHRHAGRPNDEQLKRAWLLQRPTRMKYLTHLFVLLFAMGFGAEARVAVDCQTALTASLRKAPPRGTLAAVKAAVTQHQAQAKILALAMQLTPKDRLAYAAWLLNTSLLSGNIQQAVLAAHDIGAERGFFNYTRKDLRAKAELLKNAGIVKASDRRRLMFYGAVGGLPVETEISIPRYGQKLELNSESALMAYAEFVIDSKSRPGSPTFPSLQMTDWAAKIEALVYAGWAKDDAAAMTAAFYLDGAPFDTKADAVLKMYAIHEFAGGVTEFQKDALHFVLEARDPLRKDVEKFLEAFNLDRRLIDFVLNLIDPPDLKSYDEDRLQKFLDAVKTLEGTSISVDGGEKWAVHMALEIRSKYDGLYGNDSQFVEELFKYFGMSDNDASAILSVLKRDFKRELEEHNRQKEEDLEDEDVEEALEFLMTLFGLK